MEAPQHPTRGKRMSMMALDELKRRDDLESLRKFLIAEACFPAQKDPETAPITMEELKKLARIWKLNERRNFSKSHIDREEIVATLLHHASQNKTFTKKNPSTEIHKPAPPSDNRPTSAGLNLKGLTRNYFGIRYFNRANDSSELVISSRFFTYPNPEDNIDHVVDCWRTDDFNMKDESSTNGAPTNNPANPINSRSSQTAAPNGSAGNTGASNSNRHMAGIRSKVKLMKQRNLALHLMNYSAHVDFKRTAFNVKSVQTFINVAESDDPKTVSYCMIALSNIAADAHVRSVLFEINAVHKLTNLLPHLRGRAATWAAGLLFYYFSIDKESEDRVYNASAAMLQANGASKDVDTRLVALYTLNNLMPCIDRQRVAEIIMRILFQHFDRDAVLGDKAIWSVYLTLLLNMSWFTNAHSTLLGAQVLELLSHFSNYASAERHAEMGQQVARILLAFLQLPDQASHLVTSEFVAVLVPLLHPEMPESAGLLALKASVVLSTLPALRRVLRPTALIRTVARFVLQRGQNLSPPCARDCAKFLCNVTLADPPPPSLMPTSTLSAAAAMAQTFRARDADLASLLSDGVHEAIFALLRNAHIPAATKSIALHTLQNLVSHTGNANQLASHCLDPVMRVLRETYDLGAAHVLYNLACLPACRDELVAAHVHDTVLELFHAAREAHGPLKSVFLQILVQLSSSPECVIDLLRLDLIGKLETQLQTGNKLRGHWKEVSLMLLAMAAYAIHAMQASHLLSTVRILRSITQPNGQDEKDEEEVVDTCANVLRVLSAYYWDFRELHPVMTAVLRCGDSEEVADSLSTVLYNLTCHPENVAAMLEDHSYLNVMIRLMRTGKAEVQENIIQAIATLCSHEKCTQLLLRHDLLSDLVVIALLRTSSEGIKVICSQAFYNMLCHAATRLDLLRGDLWWALMRLGRTDSRTVQRICLRALGDLSYPPAGPKAPAAQIQAQVARITALRQHNILSFMKDLSTTAHAEDLLPCMQIVHNFLSQFVKETSPTAANAAGATSGPSGAGGGRGGMGGGARSGQAPALPSLPSASASTSTTTATAATTSTAAAIAATPSSTTSSDSQQSQHPQYDFSEAEILASIRITADAIVRAPNLKTLRTALIVLLRCAQTGHQQDKIATEFLQIDILEILKTQRSHWSQHADCRLHVSRLLYELSKSRAFTKASSVQDVNTIGLAVLDASPAPPGTPTTSSSASSTIAMEMVENLVATFLQFTVAEAVPPQDLVRLAIWQRLLKEGLSTESKVLPPKSSTHSGSGGANTSVAASSAGGSGLLSRRAPTLFVSNSSGGGPGSSSPGLLPPGRRTILSREHSLAGGAGGHSSGGSGGPAGGGVGVGVGTVAGAYLDGQDGLQGASPSAFRLQGMTLSLLAYSIEALLLPPQSASSSSSTSSPLSPALLQGCLQGDFIDHPWTRPNVLSILHVVSQSTACITSLLVPDTFHILTRFLHAAVGTSRHGKAQEYTACFLRNLVLHSSVIPRLVSISANAVNDLVKEVCDELQSVEAALDVSIFFFHTANYLVQHEASLHPKLVLDMITKISSQEKLMVATTAPTTTTTTTLEDATLQGIGGVTGQDLASQLHNINKYTLSMILNKYSFQQGVDPSFIQNMLSYMQTTAMTIVPDLMRSLGFRSLVDWKGQLVGDFLAMKESNIVDLLIFLPEGAIWQPACHSDRKYTNSVILKFTQPVSKEHEKLEGAEGLPSSVFSKVVRNFEPVREGGRGEQGAITEDGDGGDGEDGDELGDSNDHDEEDDDEENDGHSHNNNGDEGGSVSSKRRKERQTSDGAMSSTPFASVSVDSGDGNAIASNQSPVVARENDPLRGQSLRGSLGNTLMASAMVNMRITEMDEEEEKDDGEQPGSHAGAKEAPVPMVSRGGSGGQLPASEASLQTATRIASVEVDMASGQPHPSASHLAENGAAEEEEGVGMLPSRPTSAASAASRPRSRGSRTTTSRPFAGSRTSADDEMDYSNSFEEVSQP